MNVWVFQWGGRPRWHRCAKVVVYQRHRGVACCRFRGHRDKVFDGTGEWECISAARVDRCHVHFLIRCRCQRRLRRSTCHVRMSLRAGAACRRWWAALLRWSAATVALRCRRSSQGPALEKRRPTLSPCLTLSCVFRFGDGHERVGEFVGAELIGAGGNHQFSEPLYLSLF